MTINQLITFNSLKPCVLILQIIHLIIPFYFKIELRLGGQINLQLYKKKLLYHGNCPQNFKTKGNN